MKWALTLGWLLATIGCRATEPPPFRETSLKVPVPVVDAVPSASPDTDQAIRRSRAARRDGRLAELRGLDESVDHYYEAVAFAHAALASLPYGSEEADRATSLYNDSLADCLRAASNHGRIDPRSHLTINTPAGTTTIPVVHRGFVWSTTDFERLLDPCAAPRNPSEHQRRCRAGLGAPQVVNRRNPRVSTTDRFLMEQSFFAATAIVRPDLGPWVGRPEPPANPDTLEFHDSIRVREIDLAGRRAPLAADFGAPVAYAQEAVGSRQYTLTGFFNPSVEIVNASLAFAEPYQRGKIPVVFVHGLLDNPYHFTDIVNALRATPGFIERYQIATFRYPTGTTFLRSASMLRRDLLAIGSTFDPTGTDPGLQNTVIVGFSMGGMLTKLQVTRSGDDLWKIASNRPLDSMITTEETREVLRKIFYFEPVPFVKRVIYLATPHGGGSPPTRILGRITSPLVRKPPDIVQIVAQLERDNPGTISESFAKIPTSVDLLTNQPPILELLRRLPVNPATTYHTILGVGYLPPPLDTGDTVVSVESARTEGAASEHHVRAIHRDICYKPEVAFEIGRILDLHAGEVDALSKSNVAVSARLPGTD